MRADARRNRERLLESAIQLILEGGADPPLDAVARHAGVGIGTLYRHFPDRSSLLDAVARHVLDHSASAAESALTEAADGHEALSQYMHAAVDRGVGVLNLIYPLLGSPDWTVQRAKVTTLLGSILKRGESEGSIRADVQAIDIVFPIIRFSRPVAVGLSSAEERAIAHRHLDIYLAGLRSGDHIGRPLAGPPTLD
jgi:AcrR family transcriptional regulator